MSMCIHYGHCRRDPDTGEVMCHYGWRDACPMDGAEEDEDGFPVKAAGEAETEGDGE